MFYVTIKVVAACVPAGAGINKAPTFGVLNRIKMCVAALLSSCQAGNQSAARCGKIFHSDLKIFDCYSPPPQLSGRLHGHKNQASDWSERSSSLPSCYCPLTLPLPLKHCRKHHTFSISNGLWCVQCAWMYPHCSPLISIRAANNPSVFTMTEEAPS